MEMLEGGKARGSAGGSLLLPAGQSSVGAELRSQLSEGPPRLHPELVMVASSLILRSGHCGEQRPASGPIIWPILVF
ncbi:mCG121598 [Mus musculus]|nr:mCG121598 [Mus musculus]